MVHEDLEKFRIATQVQFSAAIQRNAALVQPLGTGYDVLAVRSDMFVNQVEMSAYITLTAISAGLPIGTTINLTCESLIVGGIASGNYAVGDNAIPVGLTILPEALAIFTKYNTQLQNPLYAPNGIKFVQATLVAQNNDAGTNGSLTGDIILSVIVSGYRKKKVY